MIRLDQVTKRYGRTRRGTAALDEVSLHVPAGAVWAVVGPNGAGKSTLLALALGFIRPTSGRVSIGDHAPRHYLADAGAGYLPERFALPREWRIGDALRMFARLESGAAEEDAERVIAQFGLEPHLKKRAGELSRGLLQRAGLAQALLGRHALIVLDEPTEGLDPLWRIRLRDVIAELRDDGRTIIIASHDLGEVERVADRAVLLERGRVRDIIDTRAGAESTRYRIALAAPFARMAEVFPHAEPSGDHAYDVSLAGPVELSERIGALIGLGAVITAVEPLRQPLEDRVRAALEDGS